ncbi:hypothetical protein ACTWQF_31915 [Streptomyces sp. 8N114]|uniref:hypothetical protein n=1 Tax=Streptomyces sp. 8N114 TaxID=3457419 RepID=UPI003FD68F8F
MAEWERYATPDPEHRPHADQFKEELVALCNRYGYELWGGGLFGLKVRYSAGDRKHVGELPPLYGEQLTGGGGAQ